MASRQSQRIKTGKAPEGSGKKKSGGSEEQPLDIMEDDAPLAQVQAKIKKRKAVEAQSHGSEAAEVGEDAGTKATGKDQGLETPDSKQKKKKKKAKIVTDIVAIEEPVEDVPLNTQEKTPEKSQSSSKQPTDIMGKDQISHTWFKDFSTYGKWLDGFASYPIGFCSAISPALLTKLKDTDCLERLKDSSAWCMINRSSVSYPRLTKLFYINLKQKKESSDWCLETIVAGKKIEINHKTFCDVFGYEFQKEGEDQDLDKRQMLKEAKKEFFIDSSLIKHQFTHSILQAEPKILFYIFMRCIVPRDNSKELITDKVLLMMYAVMHNLHLDIPSIVMEQMLYAAQFGKKFVLPYSNLLTLFFNHFAIPLDEEETIKDGSGTISEKSLQNIGVAQTEKGEWKLITNMSEEELKEKKISKVKRPGSDEQPNMLQRLDKIDGALEEIKEELFGTRSEVALLKNHLTNMEGQLKDILENVKFSPMQKKAMGISSDEEERSEGTPVATDLSKGKGEVTSKELFGSDDEDSEEGVDKEAEDKEETGSEESGDKSA